MKRVYIYVIVGVGIGVVAIALLNRKLILKVVWDIYTEQRIKTLHPDIQKDVRRFINNADKKGIHLRVTDAFRTFREQDALYAKGITPAKGGQSYHNWGLGFDVVEIKDGKGLYDNPKWEEIGKLGERFGFEWGGRWSKPDLPHFERSFGYRTSQLLALTEQTGEKYPQIA